MKKKTEELKKEKKRRRSRIRKKKRGMRRMRQKEGGRGRRREKIWEIRIRIRRRKEKKEVEQARKREEGGGSSKNTHTHAYTYIIGCSSTIHTFCNERLDSEFTTFAPYDFCASSSPSNHPNCSAINILDLLATHQPSLLNPCNIRLRGSLSGNIQRKRPRIVIDSQR